MSEGAAMFLLSSEFTKMVVIAIALALPSSYFISKNWLNGFAFHIQLQWWYFAGAGFIALLVAWITIGIQIWKAARLSPVNSLKTE
jgi:ABC-type antimicrobial peptide transport system permease subunit